MQGEQANHQWSVPEDAVFERAPILPHDALIKPTAGDAFYLEGNGMAGDVVEYLHVDEDEGKFYHEMKQDVEPVLKNIAEMNLEQGNNVGKSKSGEWYHAARVPLVVIHAWLNKRGLQMKDFKNEIINDFLNDTDNGAFRVWKGRV